AHVRTVKFYPWHGCGMERLCLEISKLPVDFAPQGVPFAGILPPGYDQSGSVPLCLVLHGGGGIIRTLSIRNRFTTNCGQVARCRRWYWPRQASARLVFIWITRTEESAGKVSLRKISSRICAGPTKLAAIAARQSLPARRWAAMAV